MKLIEFTVKKGIETFRVAVDLSQVSIVSELDPDDGKFLGHRTMLGIKQVGNLMVIESYDEVLAEWTGNLQVRLNKEKGE